MSNSRLSLSSFSNIALNSFSTYGLKAADGRASTGTAGTPTGNGFTSRGTISVSNQEDANAAQSMLSQANQLPQGLLSLLG